MRVIVVSNDALARDGLTSILLREGQFALVGATSSAEHAAELLGATGGVLVATDDISKGEWNAIAKLKASQGIKVILITSSSKGLGTSVADTTVNRSDGTAAVIAALRSLSVPNARAVADALQLRYGGKRLSRREIEVAQYVAKGLGNRRISQLLELREQSVKNLVSCVMTKLGCDNRTQVALALIGKDKAT